MACTKCGLSGKIVFTENFTQGKQGGYAMFTVAVRNKFANFIAKRIANINGISGIINAADVTHPACNA